MARPLRIRYPGAVYHLMARGNRKATIFEDDIDRRSFFELLGQASDRYALRVYAACLMGNHYHIVGETPRANLSDAMRFVNGVYAQASNRRHGRTGHLFEARFRSLVIQRESYLKRVVRYVVLNPVRARLVQQAVDWPWSTYRATAGQEAAPEWLSLEWLDWAFAATAQADPRQQYEQYVNAPAAPKATIDTKALALGSRQFREHLARAAQGWEPDRCLPFRYRDSVRPPLTELLVGASDGRGLARSAYLAHARHGYRQSDIARHLRVDPSTVSKWLRRVCEDGQPAG